VKYRLLELLRCPETGAGLELTVLSSAPAPAPAIDAVACRHRCARHGCAPEAVNAAQCQACYGEEILEGLLRTPDGGAYPVIAGVPRLLPRALLVEALSPYHPDFLRRHAGALAAPGPAEADHGAKLSTVRAFSYQWTTFRDNFDYFRELFLSFVRPYLGPPDFNQRLVLEIGCGSGRPASVAASLGAEVVGVDLSEAVATAQAQSARWPRLHAVQGDACRPPVSTDFDFVYCVGVLQHLPDPARALRAIAGVTAPGRRLVLWVYGVRQWWYRPVDWLRRWSVRLPHRALHALSVVLALASEALLLTPSRVLAAFGPTRALAQRIPGHIYAGLPFRENVLGWFDRLGAPVTHYFTPGQVQALLEAAGFERVRIAPRPGASRSWVIEAVRRGA